MRETDEEMMEGCKQGKVARTQSKGEKIIKIKKNTNKQWHPSPVCDPLWMGFLLFVDNPESSILFTRLTAWHRLLHMAFAKNVLCRGLFTQNKRWRKGQPVAIVGLASG